MRQLVCIVGVAVACFINSDAAQLAFDVLVNVGGRVDLTGRRRLQQSAFLEEVRADEKKAAMLLRLSPHMSSASTLEYVNCCSALLPIVHQALVVCSSADPLRQAGFNSRYFVVRALELLSKLALVPENLVAVCRSPDALLRSLLDLLCASTTSLEPLVPESSLLAGDPTGRLRPPAVVLVNLNSGGGVGGSGSSFGAQAATHSTSSHFHQEH